MHAVLSQTETLRRLESPPRIVNLLIGVASSDTKRKINLIRATF
jgi:hypothetical protein